jgi:hypothetical protein
VFRHGKSGREAVLEGPAHVVLCLDGEEAHVMGHGQWSSVPGTGEGPGAEAWVASAHAAVRYGSGIVRIVASAETTRIEAKSGHALVLEANGSTCTREQAPAKSSDRGRAPAAGGRDGGPAQPTALSPSDRWQRLESGDTFVCRTASAKPSARSPVVDSNAWLKRAEAAAGECSAAANRAANAARQVLSAGSADGGPALGSAAAEHVTARQYAKGLCLVAAAALAAVEAPPEAERAAIETRLKDANARWRLLAAP